MHTTTTIVGCGLQMVCGSFVSGGFVYKFSAERKENDVVFLN